MIASFQRVARHLMETGAAPSPNARHRRQRTGPRAERDKKGTETTVHISGELADLLRKWRKRNPGTEWVFQSDRGKRPLTKSAVDKWMRRLYKKAGLTKPRGGGWHGFRRKFVTERKHHPISGIMAAGGWRNDAVIVNHYMQPDEHTTRAVIENPNRLYRTNTHHNPHQG